MASVFVPAGTGEVTIDYLDADGRVVERLRETRQLPEPVKAGGTVFLHTRTFQ